MVAMVATLLLAACGDDDATTDGSAAATTPASEPADGGDADTADDPGFTDSLPEENGERSGDAVEPGTIEGTNWVLVSYSVDGQETEVAPGIEATLLVEGDTVSLQTGCNAGSGSVEADDATITLGDVALTRALCLGPAGETETAVLGTFRRTADYRIDGETLTVTRDGPQRTFALEYRAS